MEAWRITNFWRIIHDSRSDPQNGITKRVIRELFRQDEIHEYIQLAKGHLEDGDISMSQRMELLSLLGSILTVLLEAWFHPNKVNKNNNSASLHASSPSIVKRVDDDLILDLALYLTRKVRYFWPKNDIGQRPIFGELRYDLIMVEILFQSHLLVMEKQGVGASVAIETVLEEIEDLNASDERPHILTPPINAELDDNVVNDKLGTSILQIWDPIQDNALRKGMELAMATFIDNAYPWYTRTMMVIFLWQEVWKHANQAGEHTFKAEERAHRAVERVCKAEKRVRKAEKRAHQAEKRVRKAERRGRKAEKRARIAVEDVESLRDTVADQAERLTLLRRTLSRS